MRQIESSSVSVNPGVLHRIETSRLLANEVRWRRPVLRTATVVAWLAVLHFGAPFSMPQIGPGTVSAQPGTIVTVAGNGEFALRDGGPAASAELAFPRSVAVDAWGNLYIADVGNHRVRRVDSAGVITTVAGTDVSGYGGGTLARRRVRSSIPPAAWRWTRRATCTSPT